MHMSHAGTFHNNEEIEMAVREWLQMQDPDYCHDRIFNLVPYWDKCL